LRWSLVEAEARTAELRQASETMRARITEYERTVQMLRKAAEDAEGRSQGREAELSKTNEALQARIHEHEGTEGALRKSLAESEARSTELRASIEALQLRAARHEASGTALRQAMEESRAARVKLDEHSRQLALLGEMGSMLRACVSLDEAVAVVAQQIEQIFPACSGTLYIVKPGKNLVEAASEWGIPGSSKPAFAPDECFAIRRNCVHSVRSARPGPSCKHLQAPLPSGYFCVPMIARREVLGMLHVSERMPGHLSEAEQRLALTVTEYIAMALSNLLLHEGPRD
jgi:hypothetical protein